MHTRQMNRQPALIVLLCFIVLFTASHLRAEEEPIVIAGLDNYPPISFRDNGECKGILSDICKELLRRMNVDAKLTLLSVPLLLRNLENGQVDGAYMLFFNKEREKFLLLSALPLMTSSINVYTKRGYEFEFHSLKDLHGKQVGKQNSLLISDAFNTDVKNGWIILDEAREVEFNLKKLLAGRIDCFLGGNLGTRYQLNFLGIHNQVTELPNPIVPDLKLYFGLSKAGTRIKNKEGLMKKANLVIREMHEDGTIQYIQDLYLNNDSNAPSP